MKKSAFLLSALATIASTSIVAQAQTQAQSSGDVVVMRRAIAPPAAGRWTTGDWQWVDAADTCNPKARQTRTVECRLGTTPTSASRCGTVMPATQRTTPRTETCTLGWRYTPWSAWSSTCSQNATQTRTATCYGIDGEAKGDEACAGIKRDVVQNSRQDLSGCSFAWTTEEWGPWDSSCTASASRSRTVTCQAQQGQTGFAIADGNCTGAKPPVTDPNHPEIRTGCIYGYTYGAYGAPSSTCSKTATSTRTATCRRYTSDIQKLNTPLSGDAVDASLCTAAGVASEPTTTTTPNYTSCTTVMKNGNFVNDTSSWGGSIVWGGPGEGRVWTDGTAATQTVTGLEVGSRYQLSGSIKNGSNTGASAAADLTLTSSDGSVQTTRVTAASGGIMRSVSASFVAKSTTATVSIVNRNGGGLLSIGGWSMVLVP